MTVYRIVIQEDHGEPVVDSEAVFYTSEYLSDIEHVIETQLATYRTREEHDDADNDDDEELDDKFEEIESEDDHERGEN